MNLFFLKTKKFYLILGGVVFVSLLGWNYYRNSNAPIEYETVKAERGNLIQTVEVTGKIESVTDLSLRFEIPGTVDAIRVTENSEVKSGDWLANLRLSELNAAVSQAQANLNQKLAGPSDEDKSYYQAAVDSAKSSLEQTKIDVQSSIVAAEAVLETAKNNLKLAEGGENSQIVSSAYSSAVATLQTAIATIDSGLTQADNILGVDNSLANDNFEQYLSILDSSKISLAKTNYLIAKTARDQVKPMILSLNTSSDRIKIDEAISLAENSLSKNITLLSSVGEVLTATPPVGTLTQTSLDGYKTIIDTARNAATAQYTSVIAKRQAILDAKNSYSTFLIAYSKAEKDLASIRENANNLIALKQAAYEQALASYNSRVNPPREIDVAALRASLSLAVANRDKAIIRAPIDGLVTKINKKRGEFISAAETMIQLLSPHYEVKVDIPETDIPKLKLNDVADITLDAFGKDVKFSGKIVSIDPASTQIQDVVYYKVTVALNDTGEEIKPGMTANVKITTASRDNVIFIPFRAVRSNDGNRSVRILRNGEAVEISVVVGLRADEGRVEILSGVEEGENIILNVKESKK